MSRTFQRVLESVARDEVRISVHGYDELAADEIRVRDILNSVPDGIVVEDYPEYPKGPCVLVLSGIQARRRFMSCGAFLAMRIHRPFSLPPIGLIRVDGVGTS